jgi:hypothetical protein
MKIAVLIARYLLALTFVVFGSNGFFQFIKAGPPSSEMAGRFFAVMMASHYMVIVFVTQIVAGALFLFRPTVPLALVLIAPVIVNILNFHLLMAPREIVPGAVAAVLWFVVFAGYRRAFDGILRFSDAKGPRAA